MAKSGKVTVNCPDCGSELVIDTKTGKILFHKEAKRELKDFDSLLKGLDEQKEKAADVFEREKAALEDKDRLMEEKFKEAMKRAEETPDEDIRRPFDLD